MHLTSTEKLLKKNGQKRFFLSGDRSRTIHCVLFPVIAAHFHLCLRKNGVNQAVKKSMVQKKNQNIMDQLSLKCEVD